MKKATFKQNSQSFPSWRGRVEEETPEKSKGNQKESKGNLSSIQVIRKICHFLRNDFNLKAISNDTVLENKLFVNVQKSFAPIEVKNQTTEASVKKDDKTSRWWDLRNRNDFIKIDFKENPNLCQRFIYLTSFIFYFLFFIYNKHAVYATNQFPIPELGNCRDNQECRLYCQIPQNTPACWSYGKYILAPSVLGETDVNITYPILELGNCSSAENCFIYCQQPQNQTACYRFGKDKGLIKEEKEEEPLKEVIMEAAKGELGCEGKEACIAFCNQEENREKCALFAQKYGLRQGPPSRVGYIPDEIMEKAQTELDCNSHESCSRFCSQKENQERCYQFVQENGLLKEKKSDDKVNKQETIEAAKNEFGCDSKEACRAFCEKEENREKCVSFARKYNLSPLLTPSLQLPKTQFRNAGFTKKGFQEIMSSGEQNPPQQFPSSGPGGCATEAECKAYCEKHPGVCPGFPNKITTTPPQNYIFQPLQPQRIASPPPPFNPSSPLQQFNQTATPPPNEPG